MLTVLLPCWVDMKLINLNEKDKIVGKTVLHICAERDDKDGVKILLEYGANPLLKGNLKNNMFDIRTRLILLINTKTIIINSLTSFQRIWKSQKCLEEIL